MKRPGQLISRDGAGQPRGEIVATYEWRVDEARADQGDRGPGVGGKTAASSAGSLAVVLARRTVFPACRC